MSAADEKKTKANEQQEHGSEPSAKRQKLQHRPAPGPGAGAGAAGAVEVPVAATGAASVVETPATTTASSSTVVVVPPSNKHRMEFASEADAAVYHISNAAFVGIDFEFSGLFCAKDGSGGGGGGPPRRFKGFEDYWREVSECAQVFAPIELGLSCYMANEGKFYTYSWKMQPNRIFSVSRDSLSFLRRETAFDFNEWIDSSHIVTRAGCFEQRTFPNKSEKSSSRFGLLEKVANALLYRPAYEELHTDFTAEQEPAPAAAGAGGTATTTTAAPTSVEQSSSKPEDQKQADEQHAKTELAATSSANGGAGAVPPSGGAASSSWYQRCRGGTPPPTRLVFHHGIFDICHFFHTFFADLDKVNSIAEFQDLWKALVGNRIVCYDTRHIMRAGKLQVFRYTDPSMALGVLYDHFCLSGPRQKAHCAGADAEMTARVFHEQAKQWAAHVAAENQVEQAESAANPNANGELAPAASSGSTAVVTAAQKMKGKTQKPTPKGGKKKSKKKKKKPAKKKSSSSEEASEEKQKEEDGDTEADSSDDEDESSESASQEEENVRRAAQNCNGLWPALTKYENSISGCGAAPQFFRLAQVST